MDFLLYESTLYLEYHIVIHIHTIPNGGILDLSCSLQGLRNTFLMTQCHVTYVVIKQVICTLNNMRVHIKVLP